MECFTGCDLKFEIRLCSVLLTVASETNDLFYFLYKAANLSRMHKRCICTRAVIKMLLILMKNWKHPVKGTAM